VVGVIGTLYKMEWSFEDGGYFEEGNFLGWATQKIPPFVTPEATDHPGSLKEKG